MKKLFPLFAVLVIAALGLTACGGAAGDGTLLTEVKTAVMWSFPQTRTMNRKASWILKQPGLKALFVRMIC